MSSVRYELGFYIPEVGFCKYIDRELQLNCSSGEQRPLAAEGSARLTLL
jgi:hypothetical protein